MAMIAPADGAEWAPEIPAANLRSAPSGTTALFSLLVVTVLATSFVAFMTIWFLVPGNGPRMAAALRECFDRELMSGPRIESVADIYRINDINHRFMECMAPIYREQASSAGYGALVLFGLAGLVYWLYPRWIIRRGGLVPLIADPSSELMTYLATLSREVGLSKPPKFLLAPYEATGSGLTFGRIGRRYVQLNAGVLVWFTTDRAKFRAVVLHELAHLRNRDVDTTYLTKSIWWSFVVVAMIPTVLLTIHPNLLSTPFQWHLPDGAGWFLRARTGVALLVLTGVVVLTRNAILRVRETYADARAAVCEGPDGVLREVVKKLTSTGPRWLARIRTHPHRDDRLEAIQNPDVLLRPRLWELVVVGVATGMILVNIRYVLLQSLPTLPGLNFLVVGLVCVPGLIGPLVVAVWRAAAGAREHRLPRRTVLLLPTMLVAGFLLGEQMAWLSAFLQWPQLVRGRIVEEVVTVLLLLTGGVLLSVWTASVVHGVLNSPSRDRRGALPLVVIAGVGAFASWFAALLGPRDTGILLTFLPTDGLVSYDVSLTGVPDWGATLASWVATEYLPLLFLTLNPLTLPGLALLWLVPIILAARRRRCAPMVGEPADSEPPYRVSPALVAGFLGAGAYTLIAVILLVAVKTGIPADVRRSDGFLFATHNSLVALAVIAQVMVAAVVAMLVRWHRPILIPLGVMLTGMLSFLVLELGLTTFSRAIDLYDKNPQRYFPRYNDYNTEFLITTVHKIMLQGTVLAVPAALLGLLVAALFRRLRQPATVPASRDDQNDRRAGGRLARTHAVTLGLLVVAVLAVAAAGIPNAYRKLIVDSRSGTAAAVEKPCVVGLWRETSRQADRMIDGVGVVRFISEGGVQGFWSDGSVIVEFAPESATINGHVVTWIYTGAVTANYRVEGASILYSNKSMGSTWTLTVDGKISSSGRLDGEFKPDRFTCSGDTMTQSGDSYTIQLSRVNRAG